MNRQEAEELLPWFVAGTLNEEESRAVQAFIDSGEITPQEIEALSSLAATVEETGAEEPAYDPAILKRALDRLDDVVQEPAPEPVVVSEPGALRSGGTASRGPGVWQRILETVQWSATPPLARIVVAGQFALLLGLAVLLGGEGDSETVAETVAGSGTTLTADFSVSFAPGATEADIRVLLLESEASIVSGPSALGLYQISVPEDTEKVLVAERLSAHPSIIFLQEVPQP
jgi:hypothetical protein